MKKKLGEILVSSGKISEEQLQLALQEQKRRKRPLGKVLVELKLITEQEISIALSQQMGVPYVNLSSYRINQNVIGMIPEKIIKKFNVVVFEKTDDAILVAIADPQNIEAIDSIEMLTGLKVTTYYATDDDIEQTIDKYFGVKQLQQDIQELKAEAEIEESVDTVASAEEIALFTEDVPIVKLVNSIFSNALLDKASDIHIEPFEKDVRVRFRIHGILYTVMNDIPKSTHLSLVSRIKVLANLDIAEKRAPQDGRIQLDVKGKKVDFRVSVLPSTFGEKIVIRILGKDDSLVKLDGLGLNDEDRELVEKMLDIPYGLVLVAGPTGSGKTTTLYAFLNRLNSSERNIITLEDPVEYILPGITQVQVLPKAGVTFANGLKSILRQDPDVVMVGETRDRETAEIAIQAGLTGHLVFSTIHTNDAAGTVSRLSNIGVEPYLVASGLVGVIAQRLVRLLCPNCKTPYIPPQRLLRVAGIKEEQVFYRSVGCEMCRRTGFTKRTAIYEILMMDNELQELASKQVTDKLIRQYAVQAGMRTLQEQGKRLVIEGKTTVEELFRVVQFY